MAIAEPVFSGPELCGLSACDVVDLLKSGKVSSAELIDASLTRIEQTGPSINAMVTLCPDRAKAAIADCPPATMLAGLPIGIKDLTAVQGVRSTWGTPALANHVPESSDPMVLRLEARGALVIGKTNTPEMGAGANTFNPVFGCTRNPWNTAMNAGGSSGGAAAGLAAGEVWLSQGSDLGGSLRTPASFCGIVGLRPSPGRVASQSGDAFNAMPVEGPMARSVEDCALLLDAMSGWDAVSPLSLPSPEQSFLVACRAPAGQVRIGFSPDLGGIAPVETDMAALLANALSGLQAPDVRIDEVTVDSSGVAHAFRALRALGMWAGYRATPAEVSDHFKPSLKQNIADGRALTVDDIADAQNTRTRLYQAMLGFFEHHDVLACPVTGIAPQPVEQEFPAIVAGVASRDYLDWLSFAFLATLCGLPALSLPVGRDARGLPVGLQLIGPPRGEARLLQIARRLEEATGVAATPIDPVVTHLT